MRPKIIFLDLEGTLVRIPEMTSRSSVAQSAWTTLAKLLGPDCLAAEEETKAKWEAKGYFNYLEWMEDTIRIHQKFGLNESIFTELVSSIEETPGIREAANLFHSWGSKIAIITGGFKAIAQKAQLAMRAHHAFAGCEYYFDHSGKLIHWNLLPSDYEGKADFMRLLIREYGVTTADCVFVGDGVNDTFLAKEVGVSVAFNAQAALKQVTTYVVDQPQGQDNFLAVAELIARH